MTAGHPQDGSYGSISDMGLRTCELGQEVGKDQSVLWLQPREVMTQLRESHQSGRQEGGGGGRMQEGGGGSRTEAEGAAGRREAEGAAGRNAAGYAWAA